MANRWGALGGRPCSLVVTKGLLYGQVALVGREKQHDGLVGNRSGEPGGMCTVLPAAGRGFGRAVLPWQGWGLGVITIGLLSRNWLVRRGEILDMIIIRETIY